MQNTTLKLEHPFTRDGETVHKLKVHRLSAYQWREAKKHKPDSIEFETIVLLGVFQEIGIDDFRYIDTCDYVRMSAVATDLISEAGENHRDFLLSSI